MRFSQRHGIFAMVVLAIVGCDQLKKPAANSPPGSSAAASPAGSATASEARAEDQRIENLLAGKDEDGDRAVPVEEFFAKLGQGYAIWKGEVAWFKKLADDAKAAGSPAVYAVVSEAFGAYVAAQYVIVMPADPMQRAKVIDAYNNFWKTDWDKLEPEEQEELKSEFAAEQGQKYLLLSYDP